eukprot:scaffold21.g2157.t1
MLALDSSRASQEALFEAYWQKKVASRLPRTYQQPPSAGSSNESSRLALAVMLEESHESLTSADFDALSGCPHCRYPCHLSGVPPCSPCDYLRVWREEEHLKPPGHDAAKAMRLSGGIDVAVVSAGGRMQGWKPDNQDSFFLQSLALPGALSASAPPAAACYPGTSVVLPGTLPGAAAHALLGSPAAAAAGLGLPALAMGVFDGHGRLGRYAATHVRDAIHASLMRQQAELVESGSAAARRLPGAAVAAPQTHLALALAHSFDAAAASMGRSERDFSRSGCTAVVCGVTPDGVTAMWTGDSRAVLGICSSGRASTIALPLTEDHKPGRPDERDRILAAGGRVDRTATDHKGNAVGPYRVFLPNQWAPGLALSRAFGDYCVTGVGVVPTPDITTLEFSAAAAAAASTAAALAAGCPPSELDGAEVVGAAASGSWDDGSAGAAAGDRHVLIVASDGLWEWVSNATAVRIASSFEKAEDAAHALVEAAQKHWAVRYMGRNCDDITVAVAFLPADPARRVAPA